MYSTCLQCCDTEQCYFRVRVQQSVLFATVKYIQNRSSCPSASLFLLLQNVLMEDFGGWSIWIERTAVPQLRYNVQFHKQGQSLPWTLVIYAFNDNTAEHMTGKEGRASGGMRRSKGLQAGIEPTAITEDPQPWYIQQTGRARERGRASYTPLWLNCKMGFA